MAIGHGQEEEKAYQAIEQALHHPLLESVSLENAAGIIVNFTGGDDLTLFEVQDALTRLQAQTGRQTEIVMGVINDTEMKNRVQVILVITGLGAPSLEETFSKYVVSEPVSELEETGPQKQPSPTWQHTPFSSSSTNLDIPAFLRRRSGNVGIVDGSGL